MDFSITKEIRDLCVYNHGRCLRSAYPKTRSVSLKGGIHWKSKSKTKLGESNNNTCNFESLEKFLSDTTPDNKGFLSRNNSSKLESFPKLSGRFPVKLFEETERNFNDERFPKVS